MKTSLTAIILLMLITPVTLSSQIGRKINPKRDYYEKKIHSPIQNESFKYSARLNIDNYANSRMLKNETVFDNGFLLIEKLGQLWVGSDWLNDHKYMYTYDGNNNLVEELQHKWNVFLWVINGRYKYTYNENNNRIERISQFWIDSNWVNSRRYSYTNDGSNNLIEELEQRWGISNWGNHRKVTYTYDSNNNLIEQLIQSSDDTIWVNKYKNTSIYDENNNKIGQLERDWDGSDWIISGREILTYENNHLTEYVWQLWEEPNWVDWWKMIFTYDENNNRIETLFLDPGGSDWVFTNKTKMTYDENNNLIEEKSQVWDGANWLNNWRYTSTYQLFTRIEQLTDGVKAYSLSNNYPNPFNPTTKIKYSITKDSYLTLKVFDLLGNEVTELIKGEVEAGEYKIIFDAKNLPSGIYFYRIQTSDFLKTKKMLLIK